MSPRSGIWLLIGALAAVTTGCLFAVRPLDHNVIGMHVPWPTLVVAFALAELAVVHVQLHRDSHGFSLTELVLVLGLFLVEPLALVLAQVVGAGLVLAIHRRQVAIKLAFNLALYGLTGCLAVLTFHTVVGAGDPLGARGWAGAAAAVFVATAVSDLAIFSVVKMTEGPLPLRTLVDTMTLSVPFTQGSAAIALVGVRSLKGDPWSLLLLVIPALLVLLSYRAF